MSDTRETILERSLELFARRGCEAVSVRDICAAVGIKESSLYYHFRNKRAVTEELYSLFERRADAPRDGDAPRLDPDEREIFHAVVFFDDLMRKTAEGVFHALPVHEPALYHHVFTCFARAPRAVLRNLLCLTIAYYNKISRVRSFPKYPKLF